MISGINLSTGPVAVSSQVLKALNEPPVSHRSTGFKKLYRETTDFLNTSFHTKETFLLTGSGTLANEAMLQEIKYIGGEGLILSNGEFGSRLIEQARRNTLDFIVYKREWGEKFDTDEIEKMIIHHSIRWILFCHCETSTGVINNLDTLTGLAKFNNCMCFVDCMSTVGTVPLNLAGVSMATASSGKGLASIPGLAIVFSNIEHPSKKATPVYLDLANYRANGGIPFTISSNLLKALNVSSRQKLQKEQFDLIHEYGQRFYNILNDRALVPFSNDYSKVFTIIDTGGGKENFYLRMVNKKLLLSTESDYLKTREWCQLAIFGYYSESHLKYVVKTLSDY